MTIKLITDATEEERLLASKRKLIVQTFIFWRL